MISIDLKAELSCDRTISALRLPKPNCFFLRHILEVESLRAIRLRLKACLKLLDLLILAPGVLVFLGCARHRRLHCLRLRSEGLWLL